MWTPPEKIVHPLPDAGWPDAATAAQARWFQPVQCGPVTLEQRTWIPAMVPWRSNNDGEVTPEVIGWYERFAKGRPGALVVEATGVRDIPSGPLLRIGHDRYIPGLRRLTDAVREASGGHTRLFIQII
ncbi:MAG: NADH:flavin oxidoreductase, partial [Planctomycetota bacterium]